MKMIRRCVLLCLVMALGARAATFTVSPTVVSNDYNGLITFQVNGISAGETVRLQQFYDANSNGVVDVGEFCIRSEIITDGDAKLVQGATNVNVVRDEDALANGSIHSSLRFTFAPDLARAIGSHIFRLNSPSSHFANIDVSFTVVGEPYAQTVQGTVLNNGVGVGFARVALIQNAATAWRSIFAAGTADANGNYSLSAPPGIYQVFAFRAGYVGSLATFPVVGLAPNATVTTNVSIIAATSLLAGALVDDKTNSIRAVPNAQLLVYSTNFLVAISVADSNANFSVPVTPGNVWAVQPASQSLMAESYLLPDPNNTAYFQTYTGPVTNAVVPLRHATALIYGRTEDNLGHPVAGASLAANADFGQYDSFGLSDSNGLYSLAIDAGVGAVAVQNNASAPLNNYIWPTPQFGINDGQAQPIDVVGQVATARIRSHVTTDAGAPIAGVTATADSEEVYGAYTFATADANGYLDMPVFGGHWNFMILTNIPGLIFPDIPLFTITDGVNATNDIVARTVTGSISGYVQDGSGAGVANLPLLVTNQVGATNFTLRALTDNSGHYSTPVFNGNWTVTLDPDTLYVRGYNASDSVIVSVPPANAVANFVLSSVPPPQILTTNLYDGYLDNFYSTGLDETNGSYPTLWSLVSGSLPDGLALNQFGFISGTPTNLGVFTFTVKAQDPRGSNDVKALSIRIRPAPVGPPQILTSYLNDAAVGCPYHGLLVGTNGSMPYVWSLTSGAETMPPGLTLNSDGSITGTPNADGYYSFDVLLTDADMNTVAATIQFQVNTALQLYASTLTPGEVGANYYGSLYASGGAQPQTWSIVAGALPGGLVFDPNSGNIMGIPTNTGVSYFTLRVTDGCATFDTPVALTNYPALQFLTTSLPPAPLNVPYSAQLQAAGGVAPYSWYTYNSLPYPLVLGTDGSITGTPYYDSSTAVDFVVYDALGNSLDRILTLVATSLPVLDSPALTGHEFTVHVTAPTGQSYVLQATPDFTNWSDLNTTNSPDNGFYLTDTN
ncbi:MAG TPA: carboxypeptidase-like regulatory domain-containing protein, partial [Verrucomicrobiae bacterium]|nr:carboxypeptidase-like regulatory domain-containing protein [Verrucomicrobiae bacterium]